MESSTPAQHRTKRSTYVAVFVILAIITALEVALASLNLPGQLVTSLFLLLAVGKASFVAAFYMHLKDDPPLYTYIFVLPASLLAIFILMSSIY